MTSKMTFAECLGVEEPKPHVAAPPLTRQKLPRASDGLSRRARKMIRLGAEARGESIDPDGIETQLRCERDQACGITPAARAIIDSKEPRA